MKKYIEDSPDLPLSLILERIQNRIMKGTTYFGVQTFKNPLDFWVYQEIIYQHKPDIIIEIGNKSGGSTLAFAHLCDLLDHGNVIAVDIDQSHIHQKAREHPRITFLESPATAAYEKVSSMVAADQSTFIIEDSSHTYENTLAVLRKYSQLIKLGDYFIVEDSICHHGLDVGPDPGPYEAIEQFIKENSDFKIDREKEDYFITWNPKGFLKRVR